jgi:TPR repeat protein
MNSLHRLLAGIALACAVAGVVGPAPAVADAAADIAETEMKAAREALAGKNLADAAQWFRKAAEKGSAEGQFYLGLLYQEGKGVPQDYEQALVWYRKAAAAGHAEAQYNLGNLYEKGLGTAKDPAEAIKWFRTVGQVGIAPLPGSARRLVTGASGAEASDVQPAAVSKALQDRLETAKKPPEQLAAELMERANQGDPEAQYKLGEMFEEGKGVPQDPVVGAQWKSLAASKGYKP